MGLYLRYDSAIDGTYKDNPEIETKQKQRIIELLNKGIPSVEEMYNIENIEISKKEKTQMQWISGWTVDFNGRYQTKTELTDQETLDIKNELLKVSKRTKLEEKNISLLEYINEQ